LPRTGRFMSAEELAQIVGAEGLSGQDREGGS